MSSTDNLKLTPTPNEPESAPKRVPILGFVVIENDMELYLRPVKAPTRLHLRNCLENPIPDTFMRNCVGVFPVQGAVAICLGDDIAEIEYPNSDCEEEEKEAF